MLMEKLSVLDICLKIIFFKHITPKDFVTFNDFPDGNRGFNSYAFDIRHQQDFSSQPIKVQFDFRPFVPIATKSIGCVFVPTNKIVLFSGDRQKQYDSI